LCNFSLSIPPFWFLGIANQNEGGGARIGLLICIWVMVVLSAISAAERQKEPYKQAKIAYCKALTADPSIQMIEVNPRFLMPGG
jgi:hypothetical protein